MRLNSLKRCKSFLLHETYQISVLNDPGIRNICLSFQREFCANWEIRLKVLDEHRINYIEKYNFPFNFVIEYLKELELKGLAKLKNQRNFYS